MSIKKIKRKFRTIYYGVHLDKKNEKLWLGSDYGGFFISPNLRPSPVVYSFGVGEDYSFDKQMIDQYGASVHAFDPTPRSIKWVESQETPETYHFHPFGIATKTGVQQFFLPKNEDHVSGSMIAHSALNSDHVLELSMKSFHDIISELNHERIDILKMDIEGSEYDVIPHILSRKIQIDQILLEIHPAMISNGRQRTKDLLNKLRKAGYALFGRSDRGWELSLIRI